MRTTDEKHGLKFEKILKGKKVDSCRYMTREEADAFGWYKRPLAIMFTDGTYLVLQSLGDLVHPYHPIRIVGDDEGNDGGAAFIGGGDDEHTIYTI